MLHEEVARFSELSGEDAHSTSISRIGGYLDGYEKGREDVLGAIEHNTEFSKKVEIINGEGYIPINQLLEVIDRLRTEEL